MRTPFIAASVLLATTLAQAVPISVTVPGTSDPWLAGMPPGSRASGRSLAPAQSPAQVQGLDLASGGFLTFTDAVGGVFNDRGCPPRCDPIDGAGFVRHSTGAENGISNVNAPINALMGVFLNDSQPDKSAAPGSLNFEARGLDFLALSPVLKQVFFIGDGVTSSTAVQRFAIPTGATRLFLGTMDGCCWDDNSGVIKINVTQAVPEPGTVLLFSGGLAGLGFLRRRWVRPRST